MSYDIITQSIGILASALVICSLLQKSDNNFKIWIALGATIFAVHFALLGAYAGAVVAILNATRTLLSMKFHNANKLLYFFLTLYVIVGIFICDTVIDMLPLFAGALSTIALFKLSGLKMRIAFIITEVGWLTYGIFVQSIGSIINNSFALCANMLTIYRMRKDKNHDQKA